MCQKLDETISRTSGTSLLIITSWNNLLIYNCYVTGCLALRSCPSNRKN